MGTVASLAAKVSVEGAAKAKSELTGFENQLKSASKGVNSLGASGAGLGGLTSGINAGSVASAGLSAAAAAAKVALVGMAAAAAAVGAGLAIAVKSAAEFEKTMSGVKAVSGASAAQMNQISALAMQLGKDTVFSAAQSGTAIEELIKGGVSIEDVMGGAAKAVVNLASAGGIDMASAAEIGANAMAMFNLKGEDMAHVSDLIAGAANASSMSVQDYRLSLQQAGAVMALYGQTIDSTTVSIALMGKAGIKGSDAGTSLKTMFMNLRPVTQAQKDMFNQLGITTDGLNNKFINANGTFKSARDIAEILKTSTEGYTEAEKAMALEVMFGSDAIRAGAILAKGGAAAYDEMAGSINNVTAAAVAAERLNNLSGDLEQLRGSAETLAIAFGQSMTPSLRDATQQGTALLNDVIDVMPGLIDMVGESLGTTAEEANILANESFVVLYAAATWIIQASNDLSTAASSAAAGINAVGNAAGAVVNPLLQAAGAMLEWVRAKGVMIGAEALTVPLHASGAADFYTRQNTLVDAPNAAADLAINTGARGIGSPSDTAPTSAQAGAAKFLADQKQAAADIVAGIQAEAKARTYAKDFEAAKAKTQASMGLSGNVWDTSRSTKAPAKPSAAPAPYRAPLVTGGGGSGGGGAGAAESAAKKAASIAQDATELIRDLGQETDKTMTKIADINVTLGQNIAKATADTAKAVAQASAAAEKSLSDLAKNEAVAVDQASRRGALDARLSSEDLIRGRRRSDEDDLWTYQRSLAAAKTQKERDALLKARNESLEVLSYRRQREDEDAAWRATQDAARNALEKQLHMEDLARQRAAIIEERDLKIKSLNEELAQKIADLKATALEAIAQQVLESEGRLKAMKEGFWDKIAEAARPGLKALADEIDRTIGSRLAQLQAVGGMLGAGPTSTAGAPVAVAVAGAEANGTAFARGGSTLVGELGPEIVNIPRGASVTPNNRIGGESIDYNRLASAIVSAIDGRLSVGVEDMHTALLRKRARSGSLGLS